MSKFELNDLVLIARQPSNQHVRIVGERGYISEVQTASDGKQFYEVTTLQAKGCGGIGTVTEDCLEACDSPHLKALKVAKDYDNKAHQERWEKLQERFKTGMKAVAKKWDMSYDTLLKIRRDIKEAEPYAY